MLLIRVSVMAEEAAFRPKLFRNGLEVSFPITPRQQRSEPLLTPSSDAGDSGYGPIGYP